MENIVSSAHQALHYMSQTHELFFSMWDLKVPPKVICFVWRILKNRKATPDNLKKKGALYLIIKSFYVPFVMVR